MNLAPIALFVYKRPWHTRQTVEALKVNLLAEWSDLIIFSDGPKNDREMAEVTEVRRYIRSIKGFESLRIIEREENCGLSRSIISGVTQVIGEYGRLVVLEDDLICSPYFLRFMNEALAYYETDERVISIHAYVFPARGDLPENFFMRGADCWGWATWKRGWDLFEHDGTKLLSQLSKQNLIERFDMDGTFPYTQMLRNQVAGKNDSWAIRWHASAFLADKLTLHTGKPLVRNIGLDATGVHCGMSHAFDVKLSEHPISVGNIPIAENLHARELIKVFFQSMRPSLAGRARMFLQNFLRARSRMNRGRSL